MNTAALTFPSSLVHLLLHILLRSNLKLHGTSGIAIALPLDEVLHVCHSMSCGLKMSSVTIGNAVIESTKSMQSSFLRSSQ